MDLRRLDNVFLDETLGCASGSAQGKTDDGLWEWHCASGYWDEEIKPRELVCVFVWVFDKIESCSAGRSESMMGVKNCERRSGQDLRVVGNLLIS